MALLEKVASWEWPLREWTLYCCAVPPLVFDQIYQPIVMCLINSDADFGSTQKQLRGMVLDISTPTLVMPSCEWNWTIPVDCALYQFASFWVQVFGIFKLCLCWNMENWMQLSQCNKRSSLKEITCLFLWDQILGYIFPRFTCILYLGLNVSCCII